jgi:spore coat protein CotH
MKTLREKIIEACPELGNYEVQILMEELRVNSRDENVYEAQIKVTAQSLFAEMYRWRKGETLKSIYKAAELLKEADSILADIPEISEEVAMTQLAIRDNVTYLFKEANK